MVWGIITRKGVEQLICLSGKIISEMFIDVMKTGYAMTARTFGLKHGDNILQQDNDPKHTSKKSKAFYERYSMNAMPWPSCSPT
ncbi:hypothetical protein ENBRE01_2426 [Enteropsectra breve]|nr:hypothetical protein ENBRE01_2426 [Enteropsectra breve]